MVRRNSADHHGRRCAEKEMKIGMVSRWRIWKLSGGRAFLVLLACWTLFGWVLAPFSNTAYSISILLSFGGPTALFCFLFIRNWLLRHSFLPHEGLARRIGCILACGVTSWCAIASALSYVSMSDAHRGLVWDFNILVAPLFGMAALLVTRDLFHAVWKFRNGKRHNKVSQATSL